MVINSNFIGSIEVTCRSKVAKSFWSEIQDGRHLENQYWISSLEPKCRLTQTCLVIRWAIQGHLGPLVDSCYVVVLFLMLSFNNYVSLRYIHLSLGNRVCTFLGKKFPTLPVICSFCGSLILFVICLSFPLVLGACCGSDCISSWVHLFTFQMIRATFQMLQNTVGIWTAILICILKRAIAACPHLRCAFLNGFCCEKLRMDETNYCTV